MNFRSFPTSMVLVLAVLVGGMTLTLYRLIDSDDSAAGEIVMPQKLSALARTGKVLFEENCAACHGEDAGGTDQGPPFIHAIYNPGHHADYAFISAAENGVRAHHWRFGDMPAQPQVSEQEVGAIARYVRELQEANGITYQPHRM